MLVGLCLFIPPPTTINCHCIKRVSCVHLVTCSKDPLIFKTILSELMNCPNISEVGEYFIDKEREEANCV
jgi:hypothetical protein